MSVFFFFFFFGGGGGGINFGEMFFSQDLIFSLHTD